MKIIKLRVTIQSIAARKIFKSMNALDLGIKSMNAPIKVLFEIKTSVAKIDNDYICKLIEELELSHRKNGYEVLNIEHILK